MIAENSKPVEHNEFAADSHLLTVAQQQAESYNKGKVVTGIIGTADEWNREVDRIN
ncbi:TPA: hypothetical protein ACX6QU_000133 [Photobacterium damselae]|uniref:hypothetical protein n=1 Tax=Photobacterium damselae TaxID=38293 RepID=UPI00220A1344|nr:hypothetical protein [Photobacterium damselae]BDR34903.1 hypothetical protein PDY_19510 [Photobacterium damselae subsp. damselae]